MRLFLLADTRIMSGYLGTKRMLLSVGALCSVFIGDRFQRAEDPQSCVLSQRVLQKGDLHSPFSTLKKLSKVK